MGLQDTSCQILIYKQLMGFVGHTTPTDFETWPAAQPKDKDRTTSDLQTDAWPRDIVVPIPATILIGRSQRAEGYDEMMGLDDTDEVYLLLDTR